MYFDVTLYNKVLYLSGNLFKVEWIDSAYGVRDGGTRFFVACSNE